MLSEMLPVLLEWLERLEREDPDNARVYRVLRRVYSVQAVIEEEALRILESNGLVDGIRRAAREVSVRREPLLSILGGLPDQLLDEERLRRWMLGIIEEVGSEGFPVEGAAASVRDVLVKGGVSIASMVREVLRGREDLINAVAGAASISRDAVRALVLWLIQPLLRAVRLVASKELEWAREMWQLGYCPVCGSYTRLGYFRGEGRRQYLKCQVCGMEWVYPRVKCPFCGADRPGDVVFYTPLRDRRWLRLYKCRRCGAYWKIVDEEDKEGVERGLPPRELYDPYTYILDLIAEEIVGKGEGDERG